MKLIYRTACAWIALASLAVAGEWADLNGAKGNIYQIDVGKRSFELLKETEYAPKTDIGQSRFKIHWDDQTQVIQEEEKEDFSGMTDAVMAELMGIRPDDRKAMAEGRPFEARVITLHVGLTPEPGVYDEGNRVVGRFKPLAKKGSRAGVIEVDGKSIPVSLRKRHWRIYLHTWMPAEKLSGSFWTVELQGRREGDRFVASQLRVQALPDARKTDDPDLPRVLIIGDSISMNYFEVVKEELKGVVNLHRNQGNAFSTAQGVRNMELWLGEYQEEGFDWDVIQFNHGLHDLKQAYDAGKDAFGAYAVPLDAYKANLEKEIDILNKTGAELIWCATTPVPNHNKGKYARRKGAAAEFNQAAMKVMKRHPEILVTDLFQVVGGSEVFDEWRKGVDVHFYTQEERQVIGRAVANTIRKALEK